MFNTFKNYLICFLIQHTYLYSNVCYHIAKRIPQKEMNIYYEQIKSSKERK